jgi:Flp pilus assembly pilin Flp
MTRRSHRSARGASAVEYSLIVVVLGVALVAISGFGRVVLNSFTHSTDCYAVATCAGAAQTAPAAPPVGVETVDALGNPITVGCTNGGGNGQGSSDGYGCSAAGGNHSENANQVHTP